MEVSASPSSFLESSPILIHIQMQTIIRVTRKPTPIIGYHDNYFYFFEFVAIRALKLILFYYKIIIYYHEFLHKENSLHLWNPVAVIKNNIWIIALR